jgi:hypothetical protein
VPLLAALVLLCLFSHGRPWRQGGEVRQHGACEAPSILAGRGGEEEMRSGATSTTSCGSWFMGSPVLFAERCCGAPPLLLTAVVVCRSRRGLLPRLPGAEDLLKEFFQRLIDG